MAVSSRQCNWFGIAYFLVFGGALAICIFNKVYGLEGLGTTGTDEEPIPPTQPRVGDAFTTATTVIAAVTVAAVGLELIMRSSMSAFLVYPCEFQTRTFCCFDYTMPSFWVLCVVLSTINLVVSAALTVLIIIFETYANIKIVRMAVVVGICLIDVIVSAISLKTSRACLVKEKAEVEEDMFDEETVPLDPAAEEDMDMIIPKSPMVRSPMMGESSTMRSPVVPSAFPHQQAMAHMLPTPSPRWNSSMGLSKAPASPYAASALRGSGMVGRYSPSVRQ